PAIHTISLHDALPICFGFLTLLFQLMLSFLRGLVAVVAALECRACGFVVATFYRELSVVLCGIGFFAKLIEALLHHILVGHALGDRKSTRLNSSHVAI